MDFLDPARKRGHTVRLFTGYILVGIAIALATTILVYESYGYGVDTSNGEIVQNGLLFVDSQPGQADIYLNGKLKSKTAGRFVLPAGQYNLEIKKDGYRSWQRTFLLEGHSIERFVYPKLIPSTLTPKTADVFSKAPTFTTQSPDRRWILVQTLASNATQLTFDQIDTSKPKDPKTTFNVPASLFTSLDAADSHLNEVEWSTDNKNFLLEHIYDGNKEFVVINRDEPARSFNVSRLFNVSSTKIMMRNRKIDQFYVYIPEDSSLRIGDTSAKNLSEPVLQHVVDFKSHGDQRILYLTTVNAEAHKLQARIYEGGNTYQLFQQTIGRSYNLDVAQFQNHWYYVLGSDTEDLVEIFKDPIDQIKGDLKKANPILSLQVDGLKKVTFSQNARFIGAISGQNISTYDIENDRVYRFTVSVPLTEAPAWMDGHRFLGRSGSTAIIFDYDYTNQYLLVPTSMNGGYFNRDYTLFYNLAQTANSQSAVLQSTYMLAGKDLPQN